MSAKIRRVFLLILALGLLLSGPKTYAAQDIWEQDQVPQITEPEDTTTVLGTVIRGNLKNTDTVSATKYYPFSTTVTSPDFQVAYVSHFVKRNDRVKAGDPLVEVSVTIDPVQMARAELNLRQAEDAFAQSLAQREDSLLVLERQAAAETDPYEKEILQLKVKKQTLELEQYRIRQEKSVQAQRDQVNALKAQAATTTIYSPVDGIVTDIEKSPGGTILSPGTSLVTIADESVVLLAVSSNNFLTYGMKTEVSFTGTEGVYTGQVVAASNALQGYPLPYDKGAAYILLDPHDTPDLVMSSSRVTGILADFENVVLAPHSAVYYNDDDQYYYVYRLVDGQKQKRQVRVLYQTGDRNMVTEDTHYWILWGAEEGDTLVSG